MRSVVFVLSVLLIGSWVWFGWQPRQPAPKTSSYAPTQEDMIKVNEWRVLIVKLDQKWGQVGKRFW
jgi:hypothetical protein